MKKNILFLIVLFIWTIQIFSTWNPDDTVTATWTSTSHDEALYVKVKGGFVYVTGDCVDFQGGSTPHFAIMTIKYNADLTLAWRRPVIFHSSNDQNQVAVNGMDVDNSGNVYITGVIYSGSNNDYLTLGYSSTGSLLTGWPQTYNGPGNGEDRANAIGLDNSGNVYVTGGSTSTANGINYLDIATIKYNSSGNRQWVQRFYYDKGEGGVRGDAEAFSLAIDDYSGHSHNGVYVAGWVYRDTTHKKDAWLVHYDFNGIDTNWMFYGCGGCSPWPNLFGDDFIKSVVVSPSTGDIFCTGAKWCSEGQAGYNGCYSHPENSCNWNYCIPASYEIFTARFFWTDSTRGCFTCGQGISPCIAVDECYCDNSRYEDTVDYGDSKGTSLVVGPNDYVYVAGYTQQSQISRGVPNNYDYITLKYNNAAGHPGEHGYKLWCTECNPDHSCPRANCTNHIYNSGGVTDDIARSIAIDSTGSNVFVTGTAGSHIVTIQYRTDVSGSQVCLGDFSGQSLNRGNSIAVDGKNPAHVYVAGVTNDAQIVNNHADFIVLKYTADNCTGDNKSSSPQTQELKGAPKNYGLSQNFPNPFNPSTSINYSIPKASYVSLKIYNTLGQSVMNIPMKYREPGYYSEDITASSWASGIYFYKLEVKDATNSANIFTDIKKMLFIK
jgi:hypothetical protein